ncbi:MAG: hypothetical protein UR96_C0002G0002 [candidate division WS6 bacterium GW2011_GWC1_36_11]|uniref:Uncharacterized protein n=1 Tax=candidate division WS6 bacterium GW2011_GWC1_36_11 TaxID=1619090 RepID=A0A0G0DHT3_9BACT|nr:MAG: hypothetical protein UR96_C0002G0002 [candidate division WS6 bacterium GW2011_GWC1_36_11]KKQ04431.1 MAG: hypothetical protein US14_C0011G0008 [candidate division WS6 bacterium GW2011_WS6_36_26]HAM96694.1 hypothetical protein [Patescibacteria group bacterium]
MQVVMSKKKKYFILLTGILVLAATAGISLFISLKVNSSTSYTVDKYSNVTNWCDTNLKDGKLSANCKALLINIDENSCFEVQVITKGKELKDLTVCEKNDTLTYTNDVLGYKKLMPVDVIFTYTKGRALGNYLFNNVSFDKVDDTYIQNIVNEDIENLVTIDVGSATTIKNSVDFCPKPDTLPNYITNENTKSYTTFYYGNLMDETMYRYGSMYRFEDKTLYLLLGRDSQLISKNYIYFPNPTIETSKDINKEIKTLPIILNLSKEMDETDMVLLKEISLLYDNIDEITLQNRSDLLFSILKTINIDSPISAEVYCSMGKLLSLINDKSETYTNYINKIKENITKNIQTIDTALCEDFTDKEKIDYRGLYIRIYINSGLVNQNFSIINKCLNLYDFTK